MSSKIRSFPEHIIIKIKDYIAEHIEEKLTVKKVAREFGYVPSHFSGCFHNTAGVTVEQFIIKQKYERAKQLVESGVSLMEAQKRLGSLREYEKYCGEKVWETKRRVGCGPCKGYDRSEVR